MGDLEKAIATGLVTLVVGFVLLQFQLGGTRRRLRRELHEELELLEQLDAKTHPDAHLRLSARVEVLLERYAPAPVGRSDPEPRWPTTIALFASAAGLAALIASTLPDPRWTVLLGVGAIAGTSVALIAEMVRAAARLRQVDQAVDVELRGTTGIAAEAHIKAEGVVKDGKTPPTDGPQ